MWCLDILHVNTNDQSLGKRLLVFVMTYVVITNSFRWFACLSFFFPPTMTHASLDFSRMDLAPFSPAPPLPGQGTSARSGAGCTVDSPLGVQEEGQ